MAPQPDDPTASPPTDPEDLAGRLADLEDRVHRLEAREAAAAGPTAAPDAPTASGSPDRSPAPSDPPPKTRTPGHDPEVFWALDGLRRRAEDPGAVLLTGTVTLPAGRAEWQEGFATGPLLEADWSLNAEALAALGHPIRLVLLREVLRGTHAAADLAAVDELGTTGQLYHHLRQLVAAGWLRSAGRGRYEVPAPKVVPLLVVVGSTQP